MVKKLFEGSITVASAPLVPMPMLLETVMYIISWLYIYRPSLIQQTVTSSARPSA